MPCIADECRQGRKPCPEPETCYQDLHRVTYIRERQEQAAAMARLCGADTSDAAEMGEGAGVLLWPLAIIAVVAVGSLLVAVFA